MPERPVAPRPPRRRTAIVVATGLAITGGVAATWTEGQGNRLVILALGLISGLAPLLVTLILDRRPSSPSSDIPDAEQKLKEAVWRQWHREGATRGILDPTPLRVQYAAPLRRVDEHPPKGLGGHVLRALRHTSPRPHGDVSDIVTTFRKIPNRRLIVIGEPGSGKSALVLLLTLGLLEDHHPGEPVPVLLSLSSWRPGSGGEHLHTWLARRLAEDYPFLADIDTYGSNMPQRLLTSGRVLPILDGLDELPAELRTKALSSINEAVAGVPLPRTAAKSTASRRQDTSLVLTCRPKEYEEAVKTGTRTIDGATVVELKPVTYHAVESFLIAGSPQRKSLWRPVLDEIRDNPDGPLARALTTPLMVWLARVLGPGALNRIAASASARKPDRPFSEAIPESDDPVDTVASIQRALFSAFIDAVYSTDAPPPHPLPPHRWRPEQALRWLSFLAAHTQIVGDSRDLAWWRLRDGVPRFARVLLLAIETGLVVGILVGPLIGAAFGLTFGLAAGLPAHGPRPRRLGSGIRTRWRGISEHMLIGVSGGMTIGLATQSAVGLLGGIGAGGLIGLVSGLMSTMTSSNDSHEISPTETLRADRTAGLRVGGVVGVTSALVIVMVLANESRLDIAIAVGLAVMLLVGLGMGLTYAVLFGLAVGYVAGVSVRAEFGDGTALVIMLLIGCSLGTAMGLALSNMSGFGISAWAQWIMLSRVWFPLTGRLPWSVTTFLADAHQRGVMRHMGPFYQFRHALLHDHLIARINGKEAT